MPQLRETQLVQVVHPGPYRSQVLARPVGVVADLSLDLPNARSGIHVPLTQQPPTAASVVLVSSGDPHALARPLSEAVKALSPDVPVDRMFTLAERTADDLRLLITFGWLALVFGISGLVLAAIGVYGVTSFTVQRRTREFGLRMALGATRGDVLRLVLRNGLGQCALGLAAGALAGWLLGQPLQAALARELATSSSIMYAIVCGSVTLAVLAALWWPARRATRVDPIVALRAD